MNKLPRFLINCIAISVINTLITKYTGAGFLTLLLIDFALLALVDKLT